MGLPLPLTLNNDWHNNSNMIKKILISTIIIAAIIVSYLLWNEFFSKRVNEPAKQLVTNLNVPWSISILPDESIILTERAGNLVIINDTITRITINEVTSIGEGGLLGLTLHPEFETNKYIYLYYTYTLNGKTLNKVIRQQLINKTLTNTTIIIDNIPGASIHNGGRIKFGPDNKLYITTGDSANSSLAQNLNSLAGKILRLNDDGMIPADNPYNNSPVYSYGHRNPQGLAWDKDNNLWATEHGPSTMDELNYITPGSNYGWPVITGDMKAEGMKQPVINSGTDTWAPSGIAYYNGSLFFAGLRGQAVYEYNIERESLTEHFKKEYGRMRDIIIIDNYFYVLTNNRDGRGVPSNNDDIILKTSI